jgi:hypothetical protein
MLKHLVRGLAIGAGAMFFFDPARGKRRRALVRDQLISLSRRGGDFFDKALRDTRHRIEGTMAEVTSALQHEDVTDDVLVERVRSKIGRYVSRPRAIEVAADHGRVVLNGSVPPAEVPGLLSAVWGVRGVRDVENHTTPAMEDGSDRRGDLMRGDQPDILQANWAPATRLVMGGLGTYWMLDCLLRPRLSSVALGTLGFGLVLNCMTNCVQGGGSSAGASSKEGFAHEEDSLVGAGASHRSRTPK